MIATMHDTPNAGRPATANANGIALALSNPASKVKLNQATMNTLTLKIDRIELEYPVALRVSLPSVPAVSRPVSLKTGYRFAADTLEDVMFGAVWMSSLAAILLCLLA